MPAAPRHPPGEAWSGGWAWARVPGLRIHQPERAQYPGSTLGRAGRLDLRAAAAASSAGLNLKRKKSLFRGGGGGAGTEQGAGRSPPPRLGPEPGPPLPPASRQGRNSHSPPGPEPPMFHIILSPTSIRSSSPVPATGQLVSPSSPW